MSRLNEERPSLSKTSDHGSAHASALRAWRDLLGDEGVVNTKEAVLAAQTATFATHQKVSVLLRPASTEHVRDCIRIANRYDFPIQVYSTGKNWGYGSRVPVAAAAGLMDLSRMNRILDFSERLGYVTIEPGVTQRDLFLFLKKQNSSLWMDATGSTPDSSLIGNILERGFGHSIYGNRANWICALEVVLPDGRLIHTGASAFQNSQTARVDRWGVGPSLDGLFLQSNFGIVTALTLWLRPKPEHFEAYFFCGRNENDSPAQIIEALRPLRLNGSLQSTVHIANDWKVISSLPRMATELPVENEDRAHLRRQHKIGPWNGSGGLYGTKRQVGEMKRLLKHALKDSVGALQFLTEQKLQFARKFQVPYSWFTGADLRSTIDLVEPVFNLLKGEPSDHSMGSAYWRKPNLPQRPYDPDLDKCGLIWCAPLAPLDGLAVVEMTNIAESTLLDHGFDPILSLTLLSERTVSCVVSIIYDRNISGEDARARHCHARLLDRLVEAGYYPYRLGIHEMEAVMNKSSAAELLKDLKRSLDPKNILAPGRYSPSY